MAAISISKLTVMYFVVVGFVVCNLLSVQCNADARDMLYEKEVLIDVKKMMRDPQNVLKSWDENLSNACSFIHVTCDNNQRVTRVAIPNSGLSGTLSPRIGDLSNLQDLVLFRNSLSGSLPSSLGKLKNLNALDVSGNKFSGKIPTSLVQLSNLRFLDLSNNQLSGPVPTGGSFSRFDYKWFKGNPGLCGSVVNKRC